MTFQLVALLVVGVALVLSVLVQLTRRRARHSVRVTGRQPAVALVDTRRALRRPRGHTRSRLRTRT
ncbi:hypothetical protein ACFQ34_24160 [Pseudonocardia benzenivorans]|jgi:hypothetical protein|uniref:Uncharacterized protein n=2 Tax=Pseudonocardia TaxID=1847 RepID=F4CY75_PSEUX|nr:hypothetical protein [Pseudonocardia dioxanivorans]AEA24697.1 hypothetical protein Psed_2493 [Pseudonocardia dioxanivorans CB1190]GJF01216.1 hypothetical protein PSD17_01800 [Pseudonocardia sp. D17]